MSKGTATLKKGTPIGYQLDEKDSKGKQTITYTAAKNSVVATITGLPKDLTMDSSGNIPGIEFVEPTYKDSNGNTNTMGTIIVDSSLLDASTVKITKGNYELLCDGYTKPETSEEYWTTPTSGSLKGTVSEGFTLSNDKKSLTYSKATKSKAATIATVKGLATADKKNDIAAASLTADNIDTDEHKISLFGTALKDTVTVNSAYYSFDLDSDFNGGSVAGAATNDTIVVNGTEVTVNGAKGDDYVVFYGDENTFFYAGGNGNDVIADFGSSDKIEIKDKDVDLNVADFSIDGSDVLFNGSIVNSKGVKTNKGSILLEGLDNNTTINITTGNSQASFSFNGNSISSLTSGSNTAGYVLEDSEFSLTPSTTLGKQGDSVVYSGDKNDKK